MLVVQNEMKADKSDVSFRLPCADHNRFYPEPLFEAFHPGLTKATRFPMMMELCQLNTIVCLLEALVSTTRPS